VSTRTQNEKKFGQWDELRNTKRVRTILLGERIKGGQERRIEIVAGADRSRSGRRWSAFRQRKENL